MPARGRRLEALLKDIDPRWELEPEAERMLSDLAEDFVNKVAGE